MTITHVFHMQAKRKKKEEAANVKILETEKRNKVSLMTFKNKTVIVNCCFWSQPAQSQPAHCQKCPSCPWLSIFCPCLSVAKRGQISSLHILHACMKSSDISSTSEVWRSCIFMLFNINLIWEGQIFVFICVVYLLWFLIDIIFFFFLKGEGDAKTASCHTEAPGQYSVQDHIITKQFVLRLSWMSWKWSLTNDHDHYFVQYVLSNYALGFVVVFFISAHCWLDFSCTDFSVWFSIS